MDLQKLSVLPGDILEIIKSYIPNSFLIFVNKHFYRNYHFLIKTLIPKKSYEKYIRHIIRNDNDIAFQNVLNDNIKHFIQIKNYKYKNTIYNYYVNFLSEFCIQNNSNKCRNVLKEYLKLDFLCKNRHKKNTSIHIRWKI